jgi:hypothetical protein
MVSLLVIIYIAFICLGLPDSLLGAAWPVFSRCQRTGKMSHFRYSIKVNLPLLSQSTQLNIHSK